MLEFRYVSSSAQNAPNIRDVSFLVFEGEFVAIIGADNSGKRRIVNILNGELNCSGEVLLCGKQYIPRNQNDANRRGVYCITEVSSLQDEQSLAENLFINTHRRPLLSIVNEKLCIQQARRLLGHFDLNLNPEDKAKKYSMNIKSILEIIKCAHWGARLIVLLNVLKNASEEEAALFLKVYQKLASSGISILMLTNQCNELYLRAQRLLLLSSCGRLAHTMYPEDFNFERLRSYLTNSVTIAMPKLNGVSLGKEFLRVKDLPTAGPRELSLSLHESEVLGILLRNNGQHDRPLTEERFFSRLHGKIWIDGRRADIWDERTALRYGIALFPDDPRKLYYPDLSIEENVAMPFLGRISTRGGIVHKRRLQVLFQDIRFWMDIMKEKFGYSPADACIYSVILRFLMYPYRLIVLFQFHGINDIRKTDMIFWMIDILSHRGCTFIILSNNEEKLQAGCTSLYRI